MKEAQRRSKQSGLIEYPLRRPLAGLAAVRCGRGQNSSGLLSGLDHQTAGFDSDAERLLAQDVQTGLHTVYGYSVVETVRKAQVGGVNLSFGQKLLMRAVNSGAFSQQLFEHVGALRRRLFICVAYRAHDEIAASALLQVLHRQDVPSRNPAAADQGQSNGHVEILTEMKNFKGGPGEGMILEMASPKGSNYYKPSEE